MNEKKYLNEENYEKGKRKVKLIALIVLVVGLCIGGGLIVKGLSTQNSVNSKYSEKNKADLQQKLETEKQNLISQKTELEKEIKTKTDTIQEQINTLNTKLANLKAQQSTEFHANGFSEKYYSLESEINSINNEIKTLKSNIQNENTSTDIIDKALDDSFDYCKLEAKSNSYTANYCSIKNQINNLTDFNKEFDSFDSIPFYISGAFIIIVSCMISGSIYAFAKRRELVAFTTQQVMPVAKESIDEIAPTLGNAAGEIAKGIKNGLKDDENKSSRD